MRTDVRRRVNRLNRGRLLDPTRDIFSPTNLGSKETRATLLRFSESLNRGAKREARENAVAICTTILKGDLDDDTAAMWMVGNIITSINLGTLVFVFVFSGQRIFCIS